jgi:hypothetical protein
MTGEAVPKTEVLEQPQVTGRGKVFYILRQDLP